MIEKKRVNLIKFSLSAFQSNNAEHTAINARKAMEAFCKLIILSIYGEKRGGEVLYTEDNKINNLLKISQYEKNKKYEFNLKKLADLIVEKEILNKVYQKKHQAKELSNIITSHTEWLKRYLNLLIFNGNSSAHESSEIIMTNTTVLSIQNILSELLTWLYRDVLDEPIPHKLMPYIGKYDIFISYRHTNKEWIEVLIENLKMQDYSIFIDRYEIIAGDNIEERLEDAIDKCSCGIVVYPEEDASEWLEKELKWMQKKKRRNSDFKIIPLVIESSKIFPNKIYKYADFKTKEYTEAFNDLICGIERLPPSKEYIKNKEALKLPKKTYELNHGFIYEVLESLENKRLVVLFSQDFSDIDEYNRLVEKRIESKFLNGFFTISIPSYKNKKKYFKHIAKSCALKDSNIKEVQDWKDAMEERLEQSSKDIVLFIRDLENGDKENNEEFATTLRNLKEAHLNFHALLIGRKKLASLVYESSILSPLNTAEKIFFPTVEVTLTKVDIYQEFERLREYFEELKDYKEEISNLLKKERLRGYVTWVGNKIIRHLFWKNLIIREGDYLVWRGEDVKKIGLEVLDYAN